MSKLVTIKRTALVYLKHIFLMGLIFAWFFSGQIKVSLSQAQGMPNNETEAVETEAAEEEVEEITPSAEPPQPDLPPLKERRFDKLVTVTHGAPHFCRSENFTVHVSRGSSARSLVMLEGKEIQNGELEVGSLPFGVEAAFSQSRDYLSRVSKNDRVLELEFVSREGSQHGSFSISVFYIDTDANQTTVCQINLINL